MPLPHFTQLAGTWGDITGTPGGPGTTPQEVVYLNLFEINFILPTILQAQGREPLLLLHQAKSIDLNPLNKAIGVKTQNFKYSTRAYLDAGPTETHVDFSIAFNVNVNSGGSMEVWNTLKSWYDLAWNSQNGYLHYKADTIGTIIVNQHDKKGLVLRRVTFQNAQLKDVNTTSLDWTSKEIFSATANFVADYWIDEYIDNGFTIQPPFLPGY
jgi:hypothetical protein